MKYWSLVGLAPLLAGGAACAPDAKAPANAVAPVSPSAPAAAASYPAMAPIEQYRIANAQDEIALARSSAPPSISGDADVLVLGGHGYETAIKGKNGFVCIVQRAWATDFEDAEFWNPKLRSPNCFNAPGARSVLARYLTLTEWVLAGVSKSEMKERTKSALASHAFADPEPGSMCFMMSAQGVLNDADGHWLPHLMFFLPRGATASWGANLPGSPILAHEGGALDPDTVFMIPMQRWSDGSPAPEHKVR